MLRRMDWTLVAVEFGGLLLLSLFPFGWGMIVAAIVLLLLPFAWLARHWRRPKPSAADGHSGTAPLYGPSEKR